MRTRPAGLDEAAAAVSTGTLRWTARHAPYLDSPAARAGLPATPRVKALLQLALLRRVWSRLAPSDPGLQDVTATVKRAWQRTEFAQLLALEPHYARQFQLMYAALAPSGTVTGPHRAALDRLAADGYLTPRRKSPYLHLETRYYADLAGLAHRLAPYEELYANSLAARAHGLPTAGLDVCQVTHTLFYTGDFGFREPSPTGQGLERIAGTVERLTDHCVQEELWDFAAKLILAQHCLGLDPLRTPSGAAAVRMLARSMTAEGAIPGKSAAERAPADAAYTTPVGFFRHAYQATLGTALAMLVVTESRKDRTERTAVAGVTRGNR
ncbi:DUF6895 family protein [Streptomyces sp. SM13]|uniref:DUF6895 family protein n=1 Tax=Streptomyces sp. SM13 TaxID=1983803 RepID=UPI000CD5911D|nr:hypothetical protein [Streptomyces sp. SM13]